MKRSKYTDEQILAIVKEGEAGRKVADPCRTHRITEQTYYNWLNRGQADLASEDEADHGSIYAEFFESVKQAESEAEVKQLRAMQTDDKWQRRAWWLERRYPKRWGQKSAVELSGPGGGPLAVASSADAMAELEAFLDERKDSIEAAAKAMAEAKE